MAKIVIAGKADCPYYAKAELLGDQLAKSVDSFHVHKIVKTPDEWDQWVQEECKRRKFNCQKSPLIWRELVDRGGKGVLIGGVSEFQEYALGYYGVKSSLVTSDVRKISEENLKTKHEIDKEIADFKSLSNPMKICITNAASLVSYHLMHTIASGEVFGTENELTINLLGTNDDSDVLRGIAMELFDMAHKLLRNVVVVSTREEAFSGCEAVVLLHQLDKDGDEADDFLLKRNCDSIASQIKLIDTYCSRNVKVLIAGNGPINTAVYVAQKEIKNIDFRNIITMPTFIENQAKALVAQKVKVKTSDVVDVIVWGDNEHYFCDISQTRVHNHDGPIWGPPFYSRLATLLFYDDQWVSKDFDDLLRERYRLEKDKMNHEPAFAHAAAITSLMRQWWFGSPEGQIVTIGVSSQGYYDVPEGMIFNFPAKLLPNGDWTVITDIEITEHQKEKIQECADYLLEQRYLLFPELRPPSPPPEPEKKDEPSTDSPHPPAMTPIKEETDQELKPLEESGGDATEAQSDTEVNQSTSADPALEQADGKEDVAGSVQEAENQPEAQPSDQSPAPVPSNEVNT